MQTKNPIYLDYNASTPCDPRVIESMLPYFYELPGNASSRNHTYGWEAEEAIENARERIANLIEVLPREIIFTSGATESDNLAIKGVFEQNKNKGNHIITVKTEHKAVLKTCQFLETVGAEVTYLDVDRNGLINLKQLETSIKPETILVSIMWANNETGVIQPMEEIGAICRRKDVLFFCDATQAVGKIPVNPKEIGIHLMAFTSHKMYGPKGVGALFVNRKNPRIILPAQVVGGGHEKGMRSGTLNVPGIVGFGKAAEIALSEMQQDELRVKSLRDRFEKQLTLSIEGVHINGNIENRMSHVSNLSISNVDNESLLGAIGQYMAIATGSACSSTSTNPSHVLMAMDYNVEKAKSSFRFSLGRYTKKEEIDSSINTIINNVKHLKALSYR